MLLSELACFTYAFNLLFFECWESDDDSFQFHCLYFLEIDVANSLVPQLYVGIGFGAFCEHGRFHLVCIKNKHAHDDSTLFFNEAPALVESDLHPLLNNLADRDQILRDGGNMQDIFNVGFLTFFAERDITDVPNRMRSVVSGFDIARSLHLSKFAKPFLVGCHDLRHRNQQTIRPPY